MTSGYTYNPPPWNGQPTVIAEIWRLTKDGKLAYCQIQNHPTHKAEVQCFADGELQESSAADDFPELLQEAYGWKADFRRKGWQSIPHGCTDGWICEDHPTLPWGHDGCRSPGISCPICSPTAIRPPCAIIRRYASPEDAEGPARPPGLFDPDN